MSSEWVAWHRDYERDDSLLAKRLVVVQRMIRQALDAAPRGRLRVVSMCAGDGRDLLGVLAGHPRIADVQARLVELDADLVAAGRERAAACGAAGVEFVRGDAGISGSYAGAVPADLVLECGVFGNVADEDVRTTVLRTPTLCEPGATVIWTRGRFEPDLTPTIRSWYREAGFAELEFVAIPDTMATVGRARLTAEPQPFVPGIRYFTFLERALRPSQQHGTSGPTPGRPPS